LFDFSFIKFQTSR